MSSKKLAQALDATAAKAHEVGTKVGGQVGSRVADAVVNATLLPVRSRLGHECTRPDCQHD